MESSEIYELEKSVWTETDFPRMNWHDNLLYGFAVIVDNEEAWKNELYFDIDYIFQWNQPKPPSSYYTFWISPCTLIFKNVFDLSIKLEASIPIQNQIIALNASKENKNEFNSLMYDFWEMELDNGEIKFKSEGFTQIVRKKPIYSKGMWLETNQRGGLSFDKTAC